jgi:hypothetical protein
MRTHGDSDIESVAGVPPAPQNVPVSTGEIQRAKLLVRKPEDMDRQIDDDIGKPWHQILVRALALWHC